MTNNRKFLSTNTKLCEENRIDGTEKFGRAWMIPKDAEKPVDGRMKTRNKHKIILRSNIITRNVQ